MRRTRLRVRGRAEPHLAVAKVAHRSDPRLQHLASSVQQAAVDGQGQPIGIADPIRAAEAVLAEHVVVAGRQAPRVEERQPVLVAIRYPEIVEPWLESLGEPPSLDRGFVIEVKAAFDAERRDHASRGARDTLRGVLQVVAGVVQGRPREEVAVRGAERNGRRRAEIQPGAARDHVRAVVETSHLSVKAEVHTLTALRKP